MMKDYLYLTCNIFVFNKVTGIVVSFQTNDKDTNVYYELII